jgi:hypothetical protein
MCAHVHMFIVLFFLFPLSESGFMLCGWARFIGTFPVATCLQGANGTLIPYN